MDPLASYQAVLEKIKNKEELTQGDKQILLDVLKGAVEETKSVLKQP